MEVASWQRDRLTEITSGTHAIINLDDYRSNIEQVRTLARPDQALMAIVKANAYGHGAVECAREAVRAGCRYLGVARIDEALALRLAGITNPVLVIGPPNISQIDVALANDIALTVATRRSAEAVMQAAAGRGEPAVVHLKIDTGLHRYGSMPDLAIELAQVLDRHPDIDLEGVYTHFSSSDEEDPAPTTAQIELFKSTVARINDAGVSPALVHLANSAAILTERYSGTNMVRAGIVTYGLDPSDEVPVDKRFRQILTLRSVITRRFTLEPGESVSYNRTFTASEALEAAAVPIGYADGIERHLSNTGWFMHDLGRCPIIGRVCMDQTVASVPKGAREGEALTIIGPGDDGAMTVRDVGELCQTNTYEPVTRLAARIPRLYIRDGAPYCWSVPLLGESGTF